MRTTSGLFRLKERAEDWGGQQGPNNEEPSMCTLYSTGTLPNVQNQEPWSKSISLKFFLYEISLLP